MTRVFVLICVLVSSAFASGSPVAFVRYEADGWIFESSGLDQGGAVEAIFAWRAADPTLTPDKASAMTLPDAPSVMVYFPSNSVPDWLEDAIDHVYAESDNAAGWSRIAWRSPRSAIGPVLAFMQRWGQAREYSAIPERFRQIGADNETAFIPDTGFRVLGVAETSPAADVEDPDHPDTIDEVAEFFRAALTAEDLTGAIQAGLRLNGGTAAVIQPWVGWMLAGRTTVAEGDLAEPVFDMKTGVLESMGRFYFDSRDSRNEIAMGACVCVYVRIKPEYHIDGDSVDLRSRSERRVTKCDNDGACAPGVKPD